MKFFTLAAIAIVAAQEEEETETESTTVAMGEDCMESMMCTDETLECVWSEDDMMAHCQDCTMETRMWDDMSMFVCMGDEMEASMTLAGSAMALVAAATMMA